MCQMSFLINLPLSNKKGWWQFQLCVQYLIRSQRCLLKLQQPKSVYWTVKTVLHHLTSTTTHAVVCRSKRVWGRDFAVVSLRFRESRATDTPASILKDPSQCGGMWEDTSNTMAALRSKITNQVVFVWAGSTNLKLPIRVNWYHECGYRFVKPGFLKQKFLIQ